MTRSQRNLGQQTVCVYVCACVHVNSHRYAQKETHTPACACVRVCVRVACVRASCVQVRKFTETSISASLPGSFSLFLTCARASSLSSPFSLLPNFSPPPLSPLFPPPSLLPPLSPVQPAEKEFHSLPIEGSSFREICSEQHGQCLAQSHRKTEAHSTANGLPAAKAAPESPLADLPFLRVHHPFLHTCLGSLYLSRILSLFITTLCTIFVSLR